MNDQTTIPKHYNLWTLSPLFVFLCVYLLTSIYMHDFYKMPITVAFVIASAWAIMISRGEKLSSRIERFSKGAANPNITLMIWIYILAGAFAQSAKAMGAIDATVNLTLWIVPDQLLMAGIFIAACFISLSIGTSVGTIVALTPVAIGVAERLGISTPLMVAIIIGGAFFGDNLSFISDTTIAATRTQGCKMRDKFRVNSLIVIPAAIIILIIYVIMGLQIHGGAETGAVNWIKVIPYLVVLITAAAGVNVLLVLMLGIILSGFIGVLTHSFGVFDWFGALGDGILGMGELIIIALLAGGMLEMIRHNGGINYIIQLLTRGVKTKRGAELSIAAMVCIANLCTANNTIAVLTIGPIAHDISVKYQLKPQKTASILDTFSCFIQGLIPYGAQVLMAAGLAAISPIEIVSYLYYPMCMGLFALGAILLGYPKKWS